MENHINRAPMKKARFNMTDGIVIAIALLVVFLLIFFLDPFDWFENKAILEERIISYVIELKNVDPDIANIIQNGANVLDSVTGDTVGRVEKKPEKYESYEWYLDEESGRMEKKSVEGKVDILLTISVGCQYQDGIGYIVSGHNIRVGSYLTLITSNVECNGYCINISEPNMEE